MMVTGRVRTSLVHASDSFLRTGTSGPTNVWLGPWVWVALALMVGWLSAAPWAPAGDRRFS
jgi:hypothetical protein